MYWWFVVETATNPHVLLTFHKVQNPLRLLGKTTSDRPKVVRSRQFLTLLTWKNIARHNCVHFFDIAASKSGPKPSVFYTLDSQMCFPPQRRALSSASQFLKVLRSWGALYILTWTCASRHNSVQFFISHLARWLRTRRFSEPIFRPSGATHHWKNTVNCDFPTFSRACIFFLLTFSPLWSSHFFSSPLWLLPPLLFHLSILSEVWLLNFVRWKWLPIEAAIVRRCY